MGNTLDNLTAPFEHGQAEATGVIPKDEPPRRAFISAPASVDTGLLRDALRKRGIAPFELDEVRAEGRTIPELLEDCVQQADLVVAVVGGGARENVLFELGYAMAMKKRILALVPPGEQMPFSIATTPHLRAGADNREAIDFGLDGVLSAPKDTRRPKNGTPQLTRPIGPVADELLKKLAGASKVPDEEELSEIVLKALQESGLYAGTGSDAPLIMFQDGRENFAIWSDDFEPWLGNPVLVEVRSRLSGAAEMTRSTEPITRSLERTNSVWGLLLYCEPEVAPGDHTIRHPRLFVMTIAAFLEALRNTSLGELLRQMRNQRVHGRG